GWLFAGRSRPATTRHGRLAQRRTHRGAPRQARGPHGGKRHSGRFRRAGLLADSWLRRVRLPREPRGLVRLAGLRDRLVALSSSRGLSVRHAQCAAHGLLCACHAHRGCRAERGGGLAHRRESQPLCLHARAYGRGPAWDRAGPRWRTRICADARGAYGVSLREGPREPRGNASRGGSAPSALHRGLRTQKPALADRACRFGRGRSVRWARSHATRGAVAGAGCGARGA
ncbi:MAG: hypothetical protein RL385_6103, partial [Pseudomonadota bacterium]